MPPESCVPGVAIFEFSLKRHEKMIKRRFKSWKRCSLELRIVESFVSSNIDLQVDTNSKNLKPTPEQFCFKDNFTESFGVQFNTVHRHGRVASKWPQKRTNLTNSFDQNVESRLETNKLRNIGKFFAHLLYTDRLATGSEMWADNPAFSSQAMREQWVNQWESFIDF